MSKAILIKSKKKFKEDRITIAIPAFQNKGTRYYIIARYTMNRHIDFWIRYAQTTFDNLSVIGSGLDEIASNKRSEIKIQARLKF